MLTGALRPILSRRVGSRWWTLAAVILVTAVAAALRIHLYTHGTGGTFVAIGPDVSDWVTSTTGLARGDDTVFKGNRYLFVPWLAVRLARVWGLPPKIALLNVVFYASLLLPGATLLLARRFVSLPAATLVAAWVVFKPEYQALSLSPIAYPVFAVAFVVTTAACLGAFGRWSALVAIPGALVTAASLNQGMLCLLAMLPAGLLARRREVVAAACLGGGAGLWVAEALQPRRYSAFGWMIRETVRYLGGNVAEETTRIGLGYGASWLQWAEQTFQVPGYLAVTLLGLAVLGIGIGIVRPGALPGSAADLTRAHGAALGLAWAALPSVVLFPLMASAHHVIHLEPLLATGAAMSVSALPRLWARTAATVFLVGALMLSFLRAETPYRFRFQVDQARRELVFGKRVGEVVGEDAAVFATRAPGQTPMEVLWRSSWALPDGVALYTLPEGPLEPAIPMDTILARHSNVWVATLEARDRWVCGRYHFLATGPAVRLTVPSRDPGPAGSVQYQIRLYRAEVRVERRDGHLPAPESAGHR